MLIYNNQSQYINSPVIIGKNNLLIIDNKDDSINWEMISD